MLKAQDSAKQPASGKSAGQKRSLAKLFSIIFIAVPALVICIALGGFIRFVEDVANLEQPTSLSDTDAIVVLTGGSGRLPVAIELLEKNAGKRLFMSGVNPATSDTALRKVAGASVSLFNCCVDVGRDAKDTIGNGKEIAKWAKEHDFKKLIVVTSNYHMLRSLYELGSVANDIELTAFPVINTDLKTNKWYQNPDITRLLINEYAKLNLAYFRVFFGIKSDGNLYSE